MYTLYTKNINIHFANQVTSKFSNYQTDYTLRTHRWLGSHGTRAPTTDCLCTVFSFFVLTFNEFPESVQTTVGLYVLWKFLLLLLIFLSSIWGSSFLQLEITISDIADYWTCFLINWLWLYLHTGGWLWGDYFQNLKLFLLHLFVRITT